MYYGVYENKNKKYATIVSKFCDSNHNKSYDKIINVFFISIPPLNQISNASVNNRYDVVQASFLYSLFET